MKKTYSTILLSLIFFISLITPCNAYAMRNIGINKECTSIKATNLRLDERKLWSDHVLWTRNFIISDLAGLEDKDKVLQRLLKNQDDIGTSIKGYYGEEGAKKLSELLKEHIAIAGQVVDAAKSGKKDDLEKYNKLWYENADKIAEFLNGLNPNWPKIELKDMLYKHLQLTTNEVVARLNKDWDADIVSYDKGEEHILNLADIISDGIVKQFPQKFK